MVTKYMVTVYRFCDRFPARWPGSQGLRSRPKVLASRCRGAGRCGWPRARLYSRAPYPASPRAGGAASIGRRREGPCLVWGAGDESPAKPARQRSCERTAARSERGARISEKLCRQVFWSLTGLRDAVSIALAATFRTVYTVSFSDTVYVLHAFKKKSTRGIAMPRREIEVVARRMKRASVHDAQDR